MFVPMRRYGHVGSRSEEHTSELQSLAYLVCRLLLEKKKKKETQTHIACIHSAPSSQKTEYHDNAPSDILADHQTESPAGVSSIMQNPNLSKLQQVS